MGTVSGILSVVVSGELLAAMPVFLHPLFRRKNEALALGMVVFRGAIEGTMYPLFVVSFLLLSVFSSATG